MTFYLFVHVSVSGISHIEKFSIMVNQIFISKYLKGLSTQVHKICLRNAHQTSQKKQLSLSGRD